MGSQAPSKLPIIDFTKEKLNPGTSSWVSARNEVVHALEDYGCFVAVYDKVCWELNNGVFRKLEELFDLPTETKVKNTSDKPFNGYIGNQPFIPLYESMAIEDATTLEAVHNFANLIFPSGNENFSEIMHSYAMLVSELEQMVSRMIFERYGVESYYDSYIGSTTYLFRVMKYRAPMMGETNVGASVHTDKSFLTILHQNQVNGLEVKTKNGEWIAVDFPPSSFIVMAGEAFLAWSNDRLHSPLHRVSMSGNEARYSMGLFSFINGIMQVPEELVDDEHPLRFKPFDQFELVDFFVKNVEMQTECTVRAYCGI